MILGIKTRLTMKSRAASLSRALLGRFNSYDWSSSTINAQYRRSIIIVATDFGIAGASRCYWNTFKALMPLNRGNGADIIGRRHIRIYLHTD